jgi:hypothetical protein
MSIMPEGGWDAPREGQIVPTTTNVKPQVVLVHSQSKPKSAFNVGFTGCLGIICAVIFVLLCLGVLVRLLNSTQNHVSTAGQPTVQHKATSGDGAMPDNRVHSVSEIDARKNAIPTGTELSVQGTLYTAKWGPDDYCTLLLEKGHVNVQHGEADPATYCRFSMVLTEKNKNGEDMWPGAGLMCDVSPQEMHEYTRLYHYSETVRVRGTYAPSLDFDVAAVPGWHVGVPVLEDCTIEGTADSDTQTQ